MVYGPGGYRFGDYARLGMPLAVMVLVGLVVVLPLMWALSDAQEDGGCGGPLRGYELGTLHPA